MRRLSAPAVGCRGGAARARRRDRDRELRGGDISWRARPLRRHARRRLRVDERTDRAAACDPRGVELPDHDRRVRDVGRCAGAPQRARPGRHDPSRLPDARRSSTRSPTPRRSPTTSTWTWSSPAVRSTADSCSPRSRGCCRARCRARPRPRCASSASGAATSASWWRAASRAWVRSREPAAARSARGWTAAATAASVRRNRRTPRRSRGDSSSSGCRPSLVAEKFRFITGYAPAFREVADRLEREAATHDAPLVEVPVIARVEGEGALHITLDGDEIVDLRLQIYEPPRFFESFLRGRPFSDVPDIVPRICGICPVAYQMSAIHGLERLFEVAGARGNARAAAPPVLRRMDREPHAARPPARRARLPGVRQRDRDGAARLQGRGRTRPEDQAARQRPARVDRRPGDPPGLADGGGVLEGATSARSPGARGTVRGGARPDPRRGRLGRDARRTRPSPGRPSSCRWSTRTSTR